MLEVLDKQEKAHNDIKELNTDEVIIPVDKKGKMTCSASPEEISKMHKNRKDKSKPLKLQPV